MEFYLRRVIEQSGAETLVTAVALEYVKIDAAFASPPESGVGGELVKGHGAVAELVVHLHDGGACGEGKYLCFRKHLARQAEYTLLDALARPMPRNLSATISPELATNCLLLQHSI